VAKPNPEIFRWALSRLGISPRATAMIGDSLPSDIMPAKALGLTTVWLKGDVVFGPADEGAADYVVPNLEQALHICAQHHQPAPDQDKP